MLVLVLVLGGRIVTLDPTGCQKEIAARIRTKGADYLLVLKANHRRGFEAARESGFGREGILASPQGAEARP